MQFCRHIRFIFRYSTGYVVTVETYGKMGSHAFIKEAEKMTFIKSLVTLKDPQVLEQFKIITKSKPWYRRNSIQIISGEKYLRIKRAIDIVASLF